MRAEAPDLVVVKIGGSLVSDRELDDHLDDAVVDEYAAMLGRVVRATDVPVVLVVGGGSYGHGTVRRAGVVDAFRLVTLTEANARLRWAWVEALLRVDVPSLPIQVAALARSGPDGVHSWAQEVLTAAAEERVLPVLSGDSILAGHQRLTVLGSDQVPGLVVRAWRQRALRPRVVMLSDVDGVREGRRGAAVLREVDPRDPARVLAALWRPSAADTTRGMQGKVEALLAVSADGAEAVLTSGALALARPDLLHLPHAAWPEQPGSTWFWQAS